MAAIVLDPRSGPTEEENMEILLARMREPSTWAGLALLLNQFGISPESSDATAQLVSALCAFGAIFLSEGKSRG